MSRVGDRVRSPCSSSMAGRGLRWTSTSSSRRRKGFPRITEHFGVSGDGLRAFDSGQTFRARDLVIREYHRFEGVSDPDDMAICYAIETLDGVRGVLVDAFGVYSNPLVSAFLQDVPIRTTAPAGA